MGNTLSFRPLKIFFWHSKHVREGMKLFNNWKEGAYRGQRAAFFFFSRHVQVHKQNELISYPET